jgi:diguanylate cyclase (GGDEF)-like protein
MTPSLDLPACLAADWAPGTDLLPRAALAGGMALLAVWTAAQSRFPGQRAFTALLLVMGGWMVLTTAGHATATLACKTTVAVLSWPLILAQPVLFALFLRQYAGSDDRPVPRRLAWAVGLPFGLLALTALGNGAHGLLYAPGSALAPPLYGAVRLQLQRGPLFPLWAAWGYVWILLAFGILVGAWRRAGADERGQWTVFIGLLACTLATSLAYVIGGWRPLGGDPTTLSYGLVLIALAALIRRGRLFTAMPLARQLLFEELPDPVLVLDPRGRVREANRAARQLAGRSPPEGRPLAEWPVFGAPLAQALARGEAGPLDLGPHSYELRLRDLSAGDRLLGRLLQLRDVTELREQALRDPLTGAWNRRALELRFAAVERRALALALVDIDHFKRINDTLGHGAGDAVLQAVARSLQQGLRDGDAVFRIGGEEFALLLPGADLPTALQRVDGLRAAVAAAPLGGVTVTLSGGVAEAGRHGQTLTALLAAADAALYAAKQGGRNRVAPAA